MVELMVEQMGRKMVSVLVEMMDIRSVVRWDFGKADWKVVPSTCTSV
jgi:hypothetical protein